MNLWTCGLSVFSQKVDRKKASGRWCQLVSRMQNVFTFASKQNYAEHKFTLLELTMKPHVCNFWIEAAPKLSMILELLDLFWGGLPNRDLGLNMLEPSWTTCQHDEFIINHQIQNAWHADVEKISDAWWMVGLLVLWICELVNLWSVRVFAEGGQEKGFRQVVSISIKDAECLYICV